MKTHSTNYFVLISLVTLIFLSSCKKDVADATMQYPALSPSNIDLNADTWKPILAADPTTFTLAAPDAVTSPAYIADLNEI